MRNRERGCFAFLSAICDVPHNHLLLFLLLYGSLICLVHIISTVVITRKQQQNAEQQLDTQNDMMSHWPPSQITFHIQNIITDSCSVNVKRITSRYALLSLFFIFYFDRGLFSLILCKQHLKMAVIVRRAIKSDMKAILGMIQELADFEKMPHGPALKVNDLERDGGFNGDNSLFVCFVAETDDESNRSSIVGYTLCFNTYSTWQGKTLFMEDLYVRPAHRNQGIGKLLLTKVINYAHETKCNRCEFHVHDWNPARSFYEKMGAINLTTTEGWHYYRLDKEAIDSFNEKA